MISITTVHVHAYDYLTRYLIALNRCDKHR